MSRRDSIEQTKYIMTDSASGIWEGHISSSFDSHMARQNAIIKICQSWTQISITLTINISTSHSLTAMIITKNQNAIMICYEYLNEPRYDAKTTMHIHQGTCRLFLSSDRQELEGEYYTGRDRQNFGVMSFRRSNKGTYGNLREG